MEQTAALDRSGILDDLVAAKLEQAAPVLRRWYGEHDLRRNFSKHLDEDVERTDSQRLAKLFAYHCPVSGARPSDYFNRWQYIGGLGRALVGIRFWNLDLERPFVTVVASTELPPDQESLASAVDHLRHAFSLFEPKHVRFFLPSHYHLQESRAGQFWEKRYIAAPVHELTAGTPPDNFARVEVRRAPGADSYPRYRRAFEQLLRSHPEHSEYARCESEEDLTELALQGGLFEILVDGNWAGTAAVDRASEEGLEGFRVVEFLLDGKFRGQRLGAAAQRHLVEKLEPRSSQQVLFGTIDCRNESALRTAKRVGRVDIGGYLWAALDPPLPA